MTVFQVGWTVLVSRRLDDVADQLLAALDHVRINDQDIQFGLHVLRREVRREREAARRGARANGSRPCLRSICRRGRR